MSKIAKEQVIDFLSNLAVMDITQLTKELEEIKRANRALEILKGEERKANRAQEIEFWARKRAEKAQKLRLLPKAKARPQVEIKLNSLDKRAFAEGMVNLFMPKNLLKEERRRKEAEALRVSIGEIVNAAPR